MEPPRPTKEGDVRGTGASDRLPRLLGASVIDVMVEHFDEVRLTGLVATGVDEIS